MGGMMNPCFYDQVKNVLQAARNRVYASANSAMVHAYWNIGRLIIEHQGSADRAEYGSQLIRELSKQLTADFGKGFTEANLRNMRQFYLTFPNCYTLCSELSWSHYRLLIRVKDEAIARYSVLNDSSRLYASKYQLTLPSAEELQKHIEEERRKYEERRDIL